MLSHVAFRSGDADQKWSKYGKKQVRVREWVDMDGTRMERNPRLDVEDDGINGYSEVNVEPTSTRSNH